MFNKDFYEEVKNKTREINKIKNLDERVSATVSFKDNIYSKIADEVDELLSSINLRKGRDEED